MYKQNNKRQTIPVGLPTIKGDISTFKNREVISGNGILKSGSFYFSSHVTYPFSLSE